MKCWSCGGDNPPDAAVCESCGSHTPQTLQRERDAIFARIKASDEYAERDTPARRERLPKIPAVSKIVGVAMFGVFIFGCLLALGFGIGAMVVLSAQGGGMLFLVGCGMLLPLLFMFISGASFVQLRRRLKAIEEGPIEAIPVIVLDKRTHTSGRSSVRTTYHFTAETEDGTRQEYMLWDGPLYGRVTAGDAGIIFARREYGFDFDRVE